MLLFWPPNDIRHIKGMWEKKFIVRQEEFTLAEIERRFLKRQFDEPRVIFAICYASLSSPTLRKEPYFGHKLSQQLDDQAKKFLSSPRAFKIDRKNNIVYLSAILDQTWFGREFIRKYATNKKFKDHPPVIRAVLNCVKDYVSKQDLQFLELKNYSVAYLKYDWKLNDGSQP